MAVAGNGTTWPGRTVAEVAAANGVPLSVVFETAMRLGIGAEEEA